MTTTEMEAVLLPDATRIVGKAELVKVVDSKSVPVRKPPRFVSPIEPSRRICA